MRSRGSTTVGDELVIGGRGSYAVGTDELFACADQLRELGSAIAALNRDLACIDAEHSPSVSGVSGVSGVLGAPIGAVRAKQEIEKLMLLLSQAEVQSRAIDLGLAAAAEGYGFAEHFVGHMLHGFTGQFAALLARFAPVLLLATVAGVAASVAANVAANAAAGGLISQAASSLGVTGFTPSGPGVSAGSSWLRRNNEIISSPVTVGLARLATQATGDVVAGSVGLPPQLTGFLGASGVAVGSTAIMHAGSVFGLFKETPVRPVDVHPLAVTASPAGFSERLARVPDTDATDGAQVVIEKYTIPGQPDRFEVYIAGTVTFSPVADSEPWDMTSNLANAAGDAGGSYASVAAAMELAGIDQSSPVQFTGYSQGAGTAARLAASGDYNTQGLATFGGPTGQVPIPEGFPTVIVEHSDDIVPALGGEQTNTHAVLVERAVFAGREIPTDYAVPAHHLEYYQRTAQLMDDAQSERIADAAGSLDAFGSGASAVTSTAYRFERVPRS